jgi:hypothetical protein
MKEWMNRPEDERFWDMTELHAATANHKRLSATAVAPWDTLRVTMTDDQDVALVGKAGVSARFSHYSFGQLCRHIGAPASYVRTLPTGLVADVLNHGLKTRDTTSDNDASLLLRKTNENGYRLQACLTEAYGRIWNVNVVQAAQVLTERGWKVPPARPCNTTRTRKATEADVMQNRSLGLSIQVGDTIGPAGLYASDHDLFIFLVDDAHPIDDGTGHPLFRGVIIRNSEVGDAKLSMCGFILNGVCGNHILHGFQSIFEIGIIHKGQEAWGRARHQIAEFGRKYCQSSAVEEQGRIAAARKLILGQTPEAVADLLFSKRITSRVFAAVAVKAAMDHTEDHHGNPLSAWGVAQGITRASQTTGYADDRYNLDRAAGKVLQMAF